MSNENFWEYQVQDKDGHWRFPAASGQDPHRYASREEVLRIVQIIHPGEKVRLVCFEELMIPEK